MAGKQQAIVCNPPRLASHKHRHENFVDSTRDKSSKGHLYFFSFFSLEKKK